MKLLYLSPNFENYKAAYYQNDLISCLKKKIEIINWGPGYKNFDKKLTLQQVFNKLNLSKNDVICVGHGWLSDIPKNFPSSKRYSWNNNIDSNSLNNLEYCASYDFAKHTGKKIIILNKEYVSLKEKLQFIKKGKFDIALSHYSNCEEFENISNTKFIFFPWSVNKSKFSDSNSYKFINKKYDMCFSGLLQNPYIKKKNINSFDLRNKIEDKLFYRLFDIPLFLKNDYKNKSIFWNAYSENISKKIILKILKKYKKLSLNEYITMFKSSKTTLNTLSPFNLIGPRYFESMLLGSVNFCEESKYYNKIFKKFVHYIPFKSDLSDFNDMLNYAVSDSVEIKNIIDASYTLVVENHTYDKRAENLITYAKQLI